MANIAMGCSKPPVLEMLFEFLKNAFFDMSDLEQRSFFAEVGERDRTLWDPRAPKAPFFVKAKAFEGTLL